MTETKEFRTLVVASTATGIGLCQPMTFSDIQECAEWLCGHPVWTHELAHGPTITRYRSEAKRQFPLLPSKEEAEFDYQTAADKAVATYGETLTVERGDYERGAGPVGTFIEMQDARS